MNIEKKRAFVINILYYLIIAAIIYITLRYAIYWLMPFVIGFTIAFMLKPLIRRLQKLIPISKKAISIITLILFYATIGILFTILVINSAHWLKGFVLGLPDLYVSDIEPAIDGAAKWIETHFAALDPNFQTSITSMIESLNESMGELMTSFSKGMFTLFSGAAMSVPSFVISLFFTIISSFFFVSDYQNIVNFLIRQLPEKGQDIIMDVKNYIVNSVFSFIKAYGKIMTITFIELSIGFSVVGVESPIVIAFIISVFDVLPVLGTGGIMIPWILIVFMNSQVKLGVGLLIIYLIVTVIRNILEPKIVGSQIGLHPLLMLVCMSLGAKLFGLLGFFILPLTIIIVKNLNDTGKIHIYK